MGRKKKVVEPVESVESKKSKKVKTIEPPAELKKPSVTELEAKVAALEKEKADYEETIAKSAGRKKGEIKITGSFQAKEKETGNMVVISRSGVGQNVKAALEALEWLEKLVCSVLVKVEKDDGEMEIRLAPHTSRAILEQKDSAAFKSKFGFL